MTKKAKYFGINSKRIIERTGEDYQIHVLTPSNRVTDTQSKKLIMSNTFKNQKKSRDIDFPDYSFSKIGPSHRGMIGNCEDTINFLGIYSLLKKYEEGDVYVNNLSSQKLMDRLEDSLGGRFTFIFGNSLERRIPIIGGAKGITTLTSNYFEQKSPENLVKEQVLNHYVEPNIIGATKFLRGSN